MVVVGIVALVFRLLDFPLAPLLLGFILGDMMEDNLRRALLIWDGSFAFLWQRPLTFSIICLILIVLLAPMLLRRFKNRKLKLA